MALRKFGNKKYGGTLYTSKDGAEIQAGGPKTHVGAGYSKSNKSAGIGVTRTDSTGKSYNFSKTITLNKPKISAGAGIGKAPGVRSVGAHVKVGSKSVGASVGYDKNKKKAFGSFNVNGKAKVKFGPKKPRFDGE